ncbi:MAG TPA: SDR family oxidoreductase [Anaerolineae bacterium]|nr:SDR family oxidoreductase [Anaerolineae bacterium]
MPSIDAFRLDGRVAIVTGASSGFGAAIGRLFAQAGARLVLAARREHHLKEVASSLDAPSGCVLTVQTDVTEEAQVRRVVAMTLECFGRIDVLVNSAGIIARTPVPEIEEADWDRMMAVNLKGPFLCCKHVLPHMIAQRDGRIVTIASYLGLFAGSGSTPAYNASKGGVVMLTRSIAVKHGPEGVRANAICPGFVKTELNRDIIDHAPDPEAKEREIASVYPLRRLGTPDDVACAALYLASDASNWVTGACLMLDGGLTVG